MVAADSKSARRSLSSQIAAITGPQIAEARDIGRLERSPLALDTNGNVLEESKPISKDQLYQQIIRALSQSKANPEIKFNVW